MERSRPRGDDCWAKTRSLQRVTFRITPETVGQYEYRATVADVGPELSDDDNAATASVRVVRQQIRVLLIAGYPSPEVQFLRNALLRDTASSSPVWLQRAEQGYEHRAPADPPAAGQRSRSWTSTTCWCCSIPTCGAWARPGPR